MADILIIEDDLSLRTQIARHLEASGHHALTCEDGWAGIKTLKQTGCDVIVLDIKLPGISGIDVLRQIASGFAFHPPVIIITGHGDKFTAIEALHFGAFDFLEKPFNPTLLDSTIARALENKHDDIQRFKTMNGAPASETLTAREREVATLASSGLTNEQIAGKLTIAQETVKFHLKAIFRKLGVENRVKLVARLKE